MRDVGLVVAGAWGVAGWEVESSKGLVVGWVVPRGVGDGKGKVAGAWVVAG